jgi:tetratricopeptide (TPR) repeat protein
MKIKKEILIGITVIFVLAAGFYGMNFYGKNKNRTALARRVAELGVRGGGPPETIEGLKAAIAAYEERIDRHVKDAVQTALYWKILAIRLQDRSLHNEALEALEQAISYNPEDPALQYLTGVSSAIVAKSFHDFAGTGAERERLFALSESAYLRSIELDDAYSKPRYGIGVLYIFELDRPQDAVPHILRYLEIATDDVDAMFLLARAYYMIEQFQDALELYDRIIVLTKKNANKRKEAENNRQIVLGQLYE